MNKHRQYLLMFMCLLVVALFILTACNNTSDNISSGEESATTAVAEKRTLTMSVFYAWPSLQTAIERFESRHPDVKVVIHDYEADYERYTKQTTIQLMAGGADDILYAMGLFRPETIDSGYFTDLYLLMQNDPDFHEEDYFTNMFAAMTYQDKLIAFPLSFNYQMVGVNNHLSVDLVEHFQEYDTITYREIIELYNSITDVGGLYVGKNMNAFAAVYYDLNKYVDIENKTCNFLNEDFIQFITDWKESTNLESPSFVDFSIAAQEESALQYLFQTVDSSSGSFAAYFPYIENEVFTHYIPLVTEDGKLILGSDEWYCISEASKNKELAWELLKFLTTPEANEGLQTRTFPIHKETYQILVSDALANSVENRRLLEAIDGETDEIVEEVMALFERCNMLPMQQVGLLADSVGDIIYEVITNFYHGAITAEQAASELQNKVSLYLME